MEPQAMLRTDPLDLLFENRNKLYGAYPLRKFYAQRLYISLGITFSTVILISFFIYLNFQSLPAYVQPPHVRDVILTNYSIPPNEKPVIPRLRPAAQRPPAVILYSTPVIVDQIPPAPMATTDELDLQAIGSKTVAGPPDNGQPENTGPAGAGTAVQNLDPVENKPEIYERAEQMPEFPGGIEALKRFLLKNLRMPENSLEESAQVKVIARFVVGADGRVRDIEIVQPAAAVFNNEVRRVISKMPDWKPGSQNHRNVAVYFNLPVNFVSAEQ